MGAKRLKSPYVGIVAHCVPGSVQKERDALLGRRGYGNRCLRHGWLSRKLRWPSYRRFLKFRRRHSCGNYTGPKDAASRTTPGLVEASHAPRSAIDLGDWARLCGGPGCFVPSLQAIQIIGSAFRMRGGGEDGALVARQHVEP
jgi:hypothetical protein